MFVVVTGLCLVVLIAQLLGASVTPVITLFAAAWLILVGIGCAIYMLGYAIYVLSKEHDNLHASVDASSQKKSSELDNLASPMKDEACRPPFA